MTGASVRQLALAALLVSCGAPEVASPLPSSPGRPLPSGDGIEARYGADGDRVVFARPGIAEWWEERPGGLEQGFVVPAPPLGDGPLVVDVAVDGGAVVLDGDHAWMEATPGGIRLVVDDADAVGAVWIDPLLGPAWRLDGSQIGEEFGSAVASAGDVNGDGFADIIVGSPYFAGAYAEQGRALVFHGSATGPGLAAWEARSAQGSPELGAGPLFGGAVASAGDVNGDGYDDVIVGSEDDGQGMRFAAGAATVFHGSATGLSLKAAWEVQSDQDHADFGHSVAGAGDVDADGYDDVVVGAFQYDDGELSEGRAFLYRGSASGLSRVPSWTMESDEAFGHAGISVAGLGDVNGDGYDDVAIGVPGWTTAAPDAGAVFVYAGSAAGLGPSPDWIVLGDQAGGYLGEVLAAAGDVNGDGYADLLAGMPQWYDALAELREGAAVVYLGSAAGPVQPWAWRVDSDDAYLYFGTSVAGAGDLDGDGYDDVIVGAPVWANGQTLEGQVRIYRGCPAGPDLVPAWVHESDTAWSYFGSAVAGAGDVDGDGYADAAVGHPSAFSFAPFAPGSVLVYPGGCFDAVDTDGDTIGDRCDACAGSDDAIDADGDTVPDGCDNCPATIGLDQRDEDRDGAGDLCDLCAGFDDALDGDADGAPDGCDACAGHPDLYDRDEDSVPDGCDRCAGADDRLDADLDGAADGCDTCAGADDTLDGDADRVPDGCDSCASGPDDLDADADAVPDACDVCPGEAGGLDGDGDGLATCSGDCHDGDPAVFTGAIERADGVDDDCDGRVDDGTIWGDDDGDGFTEAGGDCDDVVARIRPGAAETCDGYDDDCDGVADDGTECFDDDGDTFTELQGDCADADPLVFPGAFELLDNRVDDDCDGVVDPGHWDADGDGYEAGDCAPDDPAVSPGAPEVANGADDDCDGLVDEGTRAADDDGDGVTEDAGDCDDASSATLPGAPELANRVDDDCDRIVDEGTENFDDDGDGQAEIGGDCDDADPAIYGGAPEIADGVDDDCDGTADEGAVDVDGDGWTAAEGDCDDTSGWAHPEGVEVCDGVDNDCDDVVDDACATTTPDVLAPVESPPGGCDQAGGGPGWAALGGLLALRRRRASATSPAAAHHPGAAPAVAQPLRTTSSSSTTGPNASFGS